MKFIKGFLILTIAIFGFSYADARAQSVSGAVETQISQTDLEKKIYKEILTLPYYGVFDNIKFEVNGSTVTLSGQVYSLGLTKSTERVVKKIDGVETVINNIEMLPPSSFDDTIRRQVLQTFARSGSLYRYLQGPQPSVRIIVERGRLTLEGFVANRGDFNLANIVAGGIPNVFEVKNNLIVENELR